MKKTFKNKEIPMWLALLIGMTAFVFCNGRWSIPVTAWIWPVCILYFVRQSNRLWKKLLLLPLFFLTAFLKWYGVGGDSFFQWFLLGGLNGGVYCIPFFVDYFFAGRIEGFKKTLILPLSFASVDFLMSLSPVSSADSIAASQAGNLPLMQLASVVGIYAITFLVVWFAPVLLYGIEQYKQSAKSAAFAGKVYAVVLVSVLLFGGIRLVLAPADTPTVKAAMATGIEIGNFYEDTETIPVEDCIQSMQASVKTAAAGGAELILFNEEAFTVADADKEKMMHAFQQAAIENKIAIATGLEVEDTDNSAGGRGENKLYVIDASGNIVIDYDKTKLVPVVESGYFIKSSGEVPNQTLTLASGKEIKVAGVICMDSSFTGFVRDHIDKDTQLYLVPAWDWEPIDNYQNNWVVYRSAENGFNTMYCTYDGSLAVFDAYGRTVAKYDTDAIGFEKVVFADVPTQRVHTLYKACGAVIDWCYPACLIGAIAYGLISKKRKAP